MLNLATALSVKNFGNVALVHQGVLFLLGIAIYWHNRITWKYHMCRAIKTYSTNGM